MKSKALGLHILTLNCQHGFCLELFSFLDDLLRAAEYDFVLLQEADLKIRNLILQHLEAYSLYSSVYSDDAHAQTAVMVRNDWQVGDSQTQGWISHFGLSVAVCFRGAQRVAVASIHADFFWPWKRGQQVRQAKRLLQSLGQSAGLVVLGGDFNSALPGEIRRNDRVMRLDFFNASSHIKKTYHSRYIEPGSWFTNLIRYLAWFGFNLKLKTDHVYVSSASEISVKAEPLDVRVSDHSPVSVNLS